MIYTVKCFHAVNEVDFFLNFPCFFYDPMHVVSLISGSKILLVHLEEFLVQVLLKPSLKELEQDLASV